MRAVAEPVLLRAQLSGASGHLLHADLSQHPFSSDPSFSSFPRPLSQVAGSLYLSHGRPALEQVTGWGRFRLRGGGVRGFAHCSRPKHEARLAQLIATQGDSQSLGRETLAPGAPLSTPLNERLSMPG